MFYGYVRKSVEGNTELSFEVQEEYLKQQASILKSEITIVKEIGSGASLDTRPKFKELIDKTQPGDIIAVYDSSRAFRNTEDALHYLSILSAKNVSLFIA